MTLRGIVPALLVAGITAASAGAAEDVRGVTVKQQEFKVLEEKCLVCHNRKRIDSAVKARQNMDDIIRQMEKKGLVLTDRERQVLGHFWQKDPLKKKP
jgi:hypothetical protein